MIFCKFCGTQMPDSTNFCPSCGQAVHGGPTPPNYQQAGTPPPAYGYQNQGAYSVEQDAKENMAMAILSYIFFFVPLIAGTYKTSPYVRYHANQGTLLFIFAVGGYLALTVAFLLFTIIFAMSVAIGALAVFSLLFAILRGALVLLSLALLVLGIINAATGKMSPLPIIGNLTVVKGPLYNGQ